MRMRVTLRAGALLAGEVGAVVLLHRLGSAPGFALPHGDPAGWLRETPALDATGAMLRLLALGAAWWLLGSTLWWLLAAARGRRHRPVALALPGTRRLVEWTLALTLASGVTFTAPLAGAATPGPPTTATTATAPDGVRTGRSLVVVPPASAPPTPPPPTTPPPDPPPSTTPAPTVAVPRPTAPAAPTAAVHVIAAGENLWSIAAAHLGDLTGRPADAVPDVEVAPYWRALCDLNRATIRSGNPSLVFPSEVLQLPPA
jgi:hypothetical protein